MIFFKVLLLMSKCKMKPVLLRLESIFVIYSRAVYSNILQEQLQFFILIIHFSSSHILDSEIRNIVSFLAMRVKNEYILENLQDTLIITLFRLPTLQKLGSKEVKKDFPVLYISGIVTLRFFIKLSFLLLFPSTIKLSF